MTLGFRRAYALSLELHRASLGWPNVEQYGGIAGQLRRCLQIGVRSADGGWRPVGVARETEFERYVVMSLGSADETRLWCRYAEDLGYDDAMSRQRHGACSCEEIARMLQGLLNARQKRSIFS